MDVFISYRRDTGSDLAALVKANLEKMGVDSFFDTHNIHNEDFLTRIRNGIDNAPNFLMILTPGYFIKREGTEDYVREEILYALKQGKNLLAIASPQYDHNEVDWANEIEEIRYFKTFNHEVFRQENEAMTSAFFRTIVGNMRGSDGRKLSTRRKPVENSWYAEHGMSEEDFVWIKKDHVVCRQMDWKILERAITTEKIFADRDKLDLLVYKAYDISTYKDKYDLRPRKKNEEPLPIKIDQVYGVTYDGFLEEAEKTFGEGHFISDDNLQGDVIDDIEELMRRNNVKGFDVIDLTLVLKDTSDPEKRLRRLASLLNPDGGIIYIRELDDDYIDAYPDERNLVKKMKEILELDDGAGYRHLGKKIYTFLKRAGADRVFISDEIISTANHKPQFQLAMYQNYFSYLIPELRALAEDTESNRKKPNYQKYVEANEWLMEYYDDVESLFCSPDFYFRAGYVAGYGVFTRDDELY